MLPSSKYSSQLFQRTFAGALAVSIAPLLLVWRLTEVDVRSTLRVMR